MRRYLRAFGPATAADVTAWSAVTRLGPVVKAMDDLVQHEDENGKVLYDVADGPIADEDAPAPVRLFGTYDNVWLSHAKRDRVTDPEKRTAWMGANGASGMSLLVDGWMEGLWTPRRRQGQGARAAPAADQARAGRARRGIRPRRGPAGPLTAEVREMAGRSAEVAAEVREGVSRWHTSIRRLAPLRGSISRTSRAISRTSAVRVRRE